MGFVKHQYIEEQGRIEAYRAIAEEIAVRAGILERCGSCYEVFDSLGIVGPGSDLSEAYKIASAMLRDGDPLLEEGCDRRSLLDTIKAICEDSPMECQCMRRKDD